MHSQSRRDYDLKATWNMSSNMHIHRTMMKLVHALKRIVGAQYKHRLQAR